MCLLPIHWSETARISSRCPAHGFAADHLEAAALALHAGLRLPQSLARAACEREIRERHARFLAELAQREAEIEIHRQVLRAHFVEGGETAVPIGDPRGTARRARGITSGEPIGVAHRDPAAPAHAVHQEAGARLVEEDALVADEREVRNCARGASPRASRRARRPPASWEARAAAPGAAAARGRTRRARGRRPRARAASAKHARRRRTATRARARSRRVDRRAARRSRLRSGSAPSLRASSVRRTARSASCADRSTCGRARARRPSPPARSPPPNRDPSRAKPREPPTSSASVSP